MLEVFVKGIGLAFLVGLLVLIIGMLYALPVMWLWNWVAVSKFGFATLTFWEAWGLCALTGLLFKSSTSSSSSK